MTYRVVLSRQARRYYASVPRHVALRLAEVFRALVTNPCPSGSKRLKGDLDGLLRIRVGDLRIVYEIRAGRVEVYVVNVGPRGDIY